jgi:hypothetical protein
MIVDSAAHDFADRDREGTAKLAKTAKFMESVSVEWRWSRSESGSDPPGSPAHPFRVFRPFRGSMSSAVSAVRRSSSSGCSLKAFREVILLTSPGFSTIPARFWLRDSDVAGPAE